jgi:hypothetical protein
MTESDAYITTTLLQAMAGLVVATLSTRTATARSSWETLKTSVGPYSAKFPSSKADIPENLKKALISGVFKFKKTKLQLAAYTIAAEKCLGIKISKTQIIVSTPVPDYSVQVFSFGEKDIEKDKENWWQIVRKYYDTHDVTG